jgi:LysM repeat protein
MIEHKSGLSRTRAKWSTEGRRLFNLNIDHKNRCFPVSIFFSMFQGIEPSLLLPPVSDNNFYICFFISLLENQFACPIPGIFEVTNYAGILGKIMLDLIFIQGMKKLFYRFSVLVLTVGLLLLPSAKVFSAVGATAADLINLIQGWRAAAGNPPLIEDPLLNVTAYDTAYTMAVQELHTHIGNASGRISAYGYGDGSTVFCTENFAMSFGKADIAEIYGYWDDPDHRLPATYPYYEHVGAGVATTGNGWYYYVLHACYTSGGAYSPGTTTTTTTGDGTVAVTATSPVSQIMIPVVTSTPQSDGSVVHVVQSGQSLWSIAIEYGTKIDSIKQFNNLTSDSIYNGQELLIYPAGSMPTPQPTPTQTSTPVATRTPTQTPVATLATAVTEETPTPSSAASPRNNIPTQTIMGYAIVLISVVGLLAMLVNMSIKKIK